MTAHTGGLLTGALVSPDSAAPFGIHFDVNRAPPVFGGIVTAGAWGGAKTNTQPTDERQAAQTAGRGHAFVRDYYDRLHFSTLAFDFGNVVGQQVYTLTVWNAYFEDRPLAEIAGEGAEGISITEPRAAPTDLQPLEELAYTITVSTDGPAQIDGSYTFDFDTIDVEVTFTGSRVTPWLFGPNGQVLERLEWLTDVIQSYDGSEQRVQIRQYPRRSFEYEVMLDGAERRKAENILFGWHGRLFALPVWFDGAELTVQADAGDSTITIEIDDRDYHEGGLVALLSDVDTFEIGTVLSLGSGTITLERPLNGTWPVGTKVYPVRLARLPDQVNLRRFTGAAAYGRLRWLCDGESAGTAATETTYRGYPVLEQKPNWIEDVSQDYIRKLSEIDNRVGPVFVDDEAGLPILLQSHRWLLDGREEITAFREWLYARKGRLTAFWLPSWAQDLEVVADIGNTATNIDVAHTNYTLQVDSRIGRRDIRIELVDGTVFYRHITNAVEVDADTERLTISASLGVAVDADDIRMVSFMALGRLDGDAAELAWWRWDVAEAALNVRTATNDL